MAISVSLAATCTTRCCLSCQGLLTRSGSTSLYPLHQCNSPKALFWTKPMEVLQSRLRMMRRNARSSGLYIHRTPPLCRQKYYEQKSTTLFIHRPQQRDSLRDSYRIGESEVHVPKNTTRPSYCCRLHSRGVCVCLPSALTQRSIICHVTRHRHAMSAVSCLYLLTKVMVKSA